MAMRASKCRSNNGTNMSVNISGLMQIALLSQNPRVRPAELERCWAWGGGGRPPPPPRGPPGGGGFFN
jgi:hypothetical protein